MSWLLLLLTLLVVMTFSSSHGFLLPTTTPPPSMAFGSIITTTTSTSSSTTTSSLYCQLLGMSCRQPTDFSFSFQGFCKRGGETDIHSDGWGLAFYQNGGVRQFHDDQPAAESPLADFLVQYPIRTVNMMAHIRYATHGPVNLANVHPFAREWAGVQWVFAHNGHVPLFIDDNQDDDNDNNELPILGDNKQNQTQVYHPVGTTDSEAAFCAILNALRHKYDRKLPSLPALYQTLHELATEIVDYAPDDTILNFLMACGPHVLWVYSWPGRRPGSDVWNGLHYTVREYPFTKCHLCDLDYTVDFGTVTTQQDRVAVVATRPLTDDEEWIELEPGELILLDEGLPHAHTQQLARLEQMGHGLVNSTTTGLLQEDLRRYEFQPEFHVGGGI
ncbi:Glutamine amidotransferase [Seminavis robusta]|uniref:Glutamine amidotransferase n=1 Tax=Seminavis robusta TaxID=568900 RepID=A0A9N8DJC3_9STRA|nr:Glutamine amidotransferase [Seminavis robusta]|eukprot:Sro113_g056140.1 Glutamine amidotransferase (388) ;mRNA; f:94853-96016